MPVRAVPFVNGEYYHVFNRGVAKQPIFLSELDFKQAWLTSSYYQQTDPPIKLSRYKKLVANDRSNEVDFFSPTNSKLVDIISYVFMPNHFHFLLKQKQSAGVSKFIGNFSNSYSHYFNTKYSRTGHVFTSTFKSVSVESGEQLIHLSRYIHLNPLVAGLIGSPESYIWSSYLCYLGVKNDICAKSHVLDHFSSTEGYEQFVINHADYAIELQRVKHLTLDGDT